MFFLEKIKKKTSKVKPMNMYDVIIVGSGPAGMNAAVYSGRYLLKTLVLGEMPGGTVAEADTICNFLSYPSINGLELVKKMEEQVKCLGVETKNEKVLEISKKKDIFNVKTSSGNYSTKKIILATGTKNRKLNLKREKELIGKGVSYCATCDAAFFQDKIVGVVGGGNSAIKAALLLSEYAKKVYIIYRKDKFFRVIPAWAEQIKKNKKIEPIHKANVVGLVGKDKLEAVKLDTKQELKLDGLFVEIGSAPNNELAKQLGVKLDGEYIKVDKDQKTNVIGVFAAGDVTNTPLRQIITAAGGGAIAAATTFDELKES